MYSISAARAVLWVAVAAVLYLALTPGPAGAVIEDGTIRHSLAFLVLPWLMMAAYPRLSVWWVLAANAALGGAIELGQLWMAVGRHGAWADFALDVVVAAAAVAIGLVVRRSARLR
jgi:hypothetical protein